MTAPTWQAATAGQPPLAAQVNQLLATHAVTVVYTGTLRQNQLTAGAASTSTSGLWLGQQFSTGATQTAIGYVRIPLTTTTQTGTALAPTTLSLYANSGGAPTGAALAATTLTAEYAYGASGGTATTLVTYPLLATGLNAGSLYWLVVTGTSSTGAYTWYRSNQASGAATSTNGTAWTSQAYGFEYAVYDQTPTNGLPVVTWEDSGARWTAATYTADGLIGSLAEYTAGQTSGGYQQSYRTFSYSGGSLSGVS